MQMRPANSIVRLHSASTFAVLVVLVAVCCVLFYFFPFPLTTGLWW